MAAALVGGAFLSASLQVLLDRMASRDFLDFFRGRKHDDRLQKKLKATLFTIQIVLEDADKKQFTNEAVKNWLLELQHVVYRADDLVDEAATHQALQRQFDEQASDQVMNLPSSFTNTFQEELENIIEELEDFAKHKDVLGLKEVTVGQKFMSNRLPTTYSVSETDVYGRNNDKDKIIEMVLTDGGSENRISVIPIVGMGGIGKTTLAQLVYNDARVVEHFNKKAWVCVSEQFDVVRITQTMIGAVTPQSCDIKDLNQLQVKLSGELSGQKYLLVLDDYWNENPLDWDALKRPFGDGKHGSKVIVTTRNERVAAIMQTVPFHRVQELSGEDSWSLFSKYAFEYGDSSAHPNLQVIGKKIVNKCGGLPLAAKTLGGLLRSQLVIEEWNNILKSEIWDLPESKSDILPALTLSYHYLPSPLKRCFAHCSIFPKDYEFQKEELVLLWMAENVLLPQRKRNMTMEEVGDQCFRELLSRSFFQQSFRNESSFVMHDLINDVAQFAAGEFCLRKEDDKPVQHISEKVRHFSFARSDWNCDTIDKFEEIKDAKYLRTFLPLKVKNYYGPLYLASKVFRDMLPTLRCIRVLSLSSYAIVELPPSISNLIHLRYLDVSCTKISRLPESLTTLYNLQTLLLSNCGYLKVLPQEMWKLVCLRHLDLSGTILKEMPTGMGRLKSLQFLSTFVVGEHSGSRINALGELCHLQKSLSILSLKNVINSRDAFEAKLEGKKQLEKLVLEWGNHTETLPNEIDVLDKLRPPINLKNLTIENYGGERFPRWLGEHLFHNMVSLELKTCWGCLLLPPVGQLPSLKILVIEGMPQITIVGQEFCGDGSLMKPFQSLKILRFERMEEWEKWHMLGTGEFPSLQELLLIHCPKLTGNLPNQVVSLRRLEISGCDKLVASLPNGRVTILCNQVGLLQQCSSSLEKLVISNTPTLEELPSELSKLTNLEELVIKKCRSLKSFGNMGLPPALKILKIEECDALQSLQEGMTRLQELYLYQCSSLVSFPSGVLQSLKKLDIGCCGKLELPDQMEHCYTSIERLSLRRCCSSLKSFPLGLYPKLLRLVIKRCTNLETLSIPNGLQNQSRLQRFTIGYCPNVVSFPDGGFPDLRYFSVTDCKNLKSLPSFPSLQSLSIEYCQELECLSEGCLPSNLRELRIMDCHKLMARRKDWGLQRLASLTYFAIRGEYEENVLKTFPEEGPLPSSLSVLEIWGLQNLKSLNHEGLQHLTSLKRLAILYCPQLESLPEEALPSSLSKLKIMRCPLLEPRCQTEKGEDWHKIAHIPYIRIGHQVIVAQEELHTSY